MSFFSHAFQQLLPPLLLHIWLVNGKEAFYRTKHGAPCSAFMMEFRSMTAPTPSTSTIFTLSYHDWHVIYIIMLDGYFS